MEETELTKFKRYIQAELELIGCKEISILTIPIKNTGSTDSNEKTSSAENVNALHLEFFRKSNLYDVMCEGAGATYLS